MHYFGGERHIRMIHQRPHDLPDFERPPVNEVVLSIQFANLPAFKNVHAGLLWEQFSERYPNVEERPTLDPVFETFGVPPKSVLLPQVQLLAQLPAIRYWFVSKDETELLQVQQDRLVHNWRKRNPHDGYPRYEPLKERFRAEVEEFRQFLTTKNLGEIVPNQCEVAYINLISIEGVLDPWAQFDRIFTVWSEKYSDDFLVRAENTRFDVRFVLGEGEPWGRLHISAQPAIYKPNSQPVVRLTLTARGTPASENISSAFDWLDQGRDAVVRAFASMTTEDMHKYWGRRK